jgi:uncharacterized phage-associated protein
MPKQLSCYDVANYFLSLVDEDIGDSITNLKLQKLLYYAQGFSLVLFNKPLFKENIEAWAHGPVVPQIYHKYKEYGAKPLEPPPTMDFAMYDGDVKDLLNKVYELYGQFSAWKLRDMTHEEDPWIKGNNRVDKIIKEDDLKRYFITQIEEE